MKLTILVLTITFLFTISSCSDNDVTKPNDENENGVSNTTNVIMPLKIGNTWNWDKGGKWEIKFTQTVKGRIMYGLVNTFVEEGETYIDTTFCYNNSDGLHFYDANNDDELLYAKYPGEINDKFNTDPNLFSWYTKIISTNKTVEAVNEVFLECYEYGQYSISNGVLEGRYFFKPNVGPIADDNAKLESYILN